jgi:hypothetical protein
LLDVTWVERDRIYDFHERISADPEVNQMISHLTHIVHGKYNIILHRILDITHTTFMYQAFLMAQWLSVPKSIEINSWGIIMFFIIHM